MPPRQNQIVPSSVPRSFSISGRMRSVHYAVAGLWLMLRSQHNAWIHMTATICVIVCGAVARLSIREWPWIILALVAVWTAEALNTAFEFLADVASPDYHPLVRKAKDVAAGAVLLATIGAACVGFLVMGPPLWARCVCWFT